MAYMSYAFRMDSIGIEVSSNHIFVLKLPPKEKKTVNSDTIKQLTITLHKAIMTVRILWFY